MNTLFKDLLIYEIVLLGLGVLLFMVLIAALIYFISKDKKIAGLLWFFPLPIIMIGYPSIQGIEIARDRIKIAKNTETIIANPEDSVVLRETAIAVEKIEKRAKTTEDFVILSKTNLVLGNSDKAFKYAELALQKEPNHKIANDLKNLAALNVATFNKDSLTLMNLKKTKVSPQLRPVKRYLTRQHQQKATVQ